MTTKQLLAFEYKPELWDDSPPSRHWFSGPYKITAYDALETKAFLRKEHFHAYYKPTGWKNWGMGCEKGNPEYFTLEEAMAACQRHAEIGDYSYKGDL